MQCNEPESPQYNKSGIAYFHAFYPNGDYYFFIEKYGAFGYLSHPWRDSLMVYGDALIREFEKIYQQIGFIPKAIVK